VPHADRALAHRPGMVQVEEDGWEPVAEAPEPAAPPPSGPPPPWPSAAGEGSELPQAPAASAREPGPRAPSRWRRVWWIVMGDLLVCEGWGWGSCGSRAARVRQALREQQRQVQDQGERDHQQ